MNNITLTGRLVADPELKQTKQTAVSVCKITLAVRRPRVKDTTDFLDCVAWRQSAEYICKYGHKGDLVEVVGIMTTRKYDDKNGNHRVAYEVQSESLSLLSPSSNASSNNTANAATSASQTAMRTDAVGFDELSGDDDLPF